MKVPFKLGLVAVAAVSLGGCQSFPLTSWMFRDSQPDRAAEQQLASNPAGALEEGRASLQQGNLAAAVAAFRIAQLDRSTRADASNGLAIAYAKLGRADLAERYFQAAILADPENTKYVANLLRLQQQTMLARRNQADEALAAAQPTPRPQPDDAPLLADNVERVSRGEVRISTRPELGNAPAIAVAYSTPQRADGRQPVGASAPAKADNAGQSAAIE
jgi:tetratricopeptide (TPR) repeat protein